MNHIHTDKENNSDFSLVVWNIEGLVNKLSDQTFVHYITSFDICCLMESFTSSFFDFSVYFDDFIVLHSPAEKLTKMGRPSGGLVVLVKKSLADYVSKIETNVSNVLCLRLSKTLFNIDKDVIFISIYNHPVKSVFYKNKEYNCTIDEMEQFMLSFIEAGTDAHFLIGGDLNARIGEWSLESEEFLEDDILSRNNSQYERKTEDLTENVFGKRLKEFCTSFQFLPLNGLIEKKCDGRYTYFADNDGKSAVDYFLCSLNFLHFVNSLFIPTRVESKHMPVELRVTKAITNGSADVRKEKYYDKVRWDPSKERIFDRKMLSAESLNALSEATELLETDIEAALRKFTSTLHVAGDCMRYKVKIGGTKRAKQKVRWFDHECEQQKREAKRALARYRRTKKDSDKINFKEKKSQYQKSIKAKKKTYYENQRKHLLDIKKDGVKFWSAIRNVKRKIHEKVSIDLDVWREHFQRVLGQSGDSTETEVNNLNKDGYDISIPDLDRPITEQEVRKAIGRLKSGKASGIDEIYVEHLKSAEKYVTPFLTKLFNKLYDSGYFPKDWTRSIIVPLFKKGDKTNPENYRGISLLCITSKVFTSILNTRLYAWAEHEKKISDEQAGFRKEYSTIDHIFTIVSMIQETFTNSRKGKLYVAFIDYMKAFDTVNRDSLWKLLKKVKASTKMIRMLQGMYSSVQACVRWDESFSDFFSCPGGLKQGCLLSPLLFSLLISEVADEVRSKGKHGLQFLPGLKELVLLLFADDIILNSYTPTGLQKQLNNLTTASERLGLKVNFDKTKIMIFRKGGHRSKSEKWYIKGQEIEVVNSYKYLGFTLTTKLSYAIALEEVTRKAKRKVIEIFKTMWSLGGLDVSVYFKLFDAQVKPMLLYASEVWGTTQLKVVESVHLFACKMVLNVSSRTPNIMAYGETGRYPLYIDSTISSLRYWFKLQKMSIQRIPRQAFCMLCRQKNSQENEVEWKTIGWAQSIKTCLDNHGFSEVWLNGGVGNEKLFLKVFRQRMMDCYQQAWVAKLNDSPRFESYRTFKSILQRECYLSKITISKFRYVFTRFRLGLNDLKVNKRYCRTDAIDVICPFCDSLENEVHFMFRCPAYQHLRDKYMKMPLYFDSDTELLRRLLCHQDTSTIRDISMYIFYSLKFREETMMEMNTQN